VRPGILTRTGLVGVPSRPLCWLSRSTLTTFESSSQPSSSSQSGSRSKKRCKLTATPNAPTATDLDTPLPNVPRNTLPATIVHFIILARPKDAKTRPAPRVVTSRRSPATAPHPPPTALTVVTSTMPSLGSAGLDPSHCLSPRPPTFQRRTI